MQLVTHQTGPQGQKVQRVLIEERRRLIASFTSALSSIAPQGSWCLWLRRPAAWRLKKVAAKTPEAIFKETIDPAVGLAP